ncbi:MAG: VOC family protein [Hyphomicrobiales bacterium]
MANETQSQAPVTGVVPYVNIEGAGEASAFYQCAFGAKELARIPAGDGKRLMHCHLEINGGALMLSDCFPERGSGIEPSKSFTMHLQVDDVDGWWKRAVEAGCEVTLPLAVMFWGDKYGKLRDPFQVNWSLGAPAKTARDKTA